MNFLPPELLIAVFKSIIDTDDRRTRYPDRRTTLALVSKSWHELVDETPSLWTRIEWQNSGFLTTAALHPLTRPPPRHVCYSARELHVSFTGDPTFPLLHHLLSTIPKPHLLALDTRVGLNMEDGPLTNFAAHLTALEAVGNISHINIDAFPEDTNTFLCRAPPNSSKHLTIVLYGVAPGLLGNALKAHPTAFKPIITSGANEDERSMVEGIVGAERLFWNVEEDMREYPHELEGW